MIVDWFTIIAQAINFLVLVWLMKRFLYKPIHLAIAHREKNVSLRLEDAERKRSEAQSEISDYKKKNMNFDQERKLLLKKATEDAQEQRNQLLSDAQKAVDTLKKQGQESLKNDEERLSKDLSICTQKEVFSIARKALKDLSGTSLEEQIVTQFILKIQNLSDNEKEKLKSSLQRSPNSIIVKTSFNLPEGLQADIEKAVVLFLKPNAQFRFETSSDLICGIEIGTNGQKISWSFEHYMSSLEEDVRKLLAMTNPGKTQSEPNSRDSAPEIRSP